MQSPTLKLYDFKVYDERIEPDEDDDEVSWGDNKEFKIQMFGMDEEGNEYSVWVNNYKPFFYIKVGDDWKKQDKTLLKEHIMKLIKKMN